ncbi:MAG: accessory factor UbiK family protein [Gammaproteobacteria bacterium]
MLDPKILDDLSKRITSGLPQGLLALQDDVKKNLGMAFEQALARLDLVTREEFEVQQGVLARTRARLEALEARVRELETQRDPDA